MEKILNSYDSQQFLLNYADLPKTQLVQTSQEITLPLPLVLKLVSNQAIHKTEINGVRFAHTKEELEKEFTSLLELSKKLEIQGILAQEFIEGEQLIIGIKKDSVFGHVILFGLGGIYTELLKDTAIRKCPITAQDAKEMIDSLQSKQLFHNFRNKKLNTKLLIKNLVNISRLPLKYKDIQELDINPFILNQKEGKAVDIRIVFN
nr:hypothetical protein [Nanoarchaeum sp.]